MKYFLIVAALLIGLSAPAHAEGGDEARPWPLTLRAQMLRLADVDWRMRLAATPRCPAIASGIGVTVDHAAAYPATSATLAVRELRLGNLPQVVSVATGSPAEAARIRPGDELVAIGADALRQVEAQSADPTLFADEVMDRLAALPADRPLMLVLQRGRTQLRKTVVPVPICASRTTLETAGSLDAHSDSRNIAITSMLVSFTASDDELALIVGHELAHIILEGSGKAVPADGPATEAAADILGARIAHCAGYDVKRASGFWTRFEEQDDLRMERLPTHPAPSARERRIASELANFSCPLSPRP